MGPFVRGSISLLILALVFLGAIYAIFPVPCQEPIAYSIGELDPRFKISKEVFLKNIQQAEGAWEKAAGKELFTYDPSADFTINMKYDERQASTDKAKTFTRSLEKTSRTRESVLKQYQDARRAYDAALVRYEENQAALSRDIATYKATVERYNRQGGAPPEAYVQLKEEQEDLAQRSEVLEKDRLALNVLAAKVNSLAESEGEIVQTYNETVKEFNEEFADKREFDQGVYTGNSITIYEFLKHSDLVLVLTHEMGHALGIGHVPEPTAVMYYMVHDKNLTARGLSESDISALRVQCAKSPFDVFWERLNAAPAASILKDILTFK